jgi:hypothetical protein
MFEPEVLERSCIQFQKAGAFMAFTLMSQGINICTNVIQPSVILDQKNFALVCNHSYIKQPQL